MAIRPIIVRSFCLLLLLIAILVLPGSALVEKRITFIHIKAQDGGPDGFGEVIYERQGKVIELMATGTGNVEINDLLAEAVASDTVFLNMYHEIVQMIALGSTKNVMIDVHLRNHATAQWNWQNNGNFEMEFQILKNRPRLSRPAP